MGDVEICLTNEERVVTIYEMKSKEVTIADMDRALQKIASRVPSIDNYVFITTEAIDEKVRDHARTLYEKTAGTEVVVLNCIGFHPSLPASVSSSQDHIFERLSSFVTRGAG